MADPRRQSSGLLGHILSDAEQRELKARDFFGFEFRGDNKNEAEKDATASFVPPLEENESSFIVSGTGFSGFTIDLRGDGFKSDRDLIAKYRGAAMQPEVDQAIQDIVNEAIVSNDEDLPISLNLDHTELDEKIREKIIDEFDGILRMLDFRKYGHDIFRRWYVDGRIAYHVVIDMSDPTKGIQELRPISPMKIRRIKEIEEKLDQRTGAVMITGVQEYYIYSEDGFQQGHTTGSSQTGGQMSSTGLKIPKDSIIYVTSGIADSTKQTSLSYIHKALRAINMLRMAEDSLLIYRYSRAPERRIFSIDVGDMPKTQAESYMQTIMAKYKNKIVYNAESGNISDSRKHMHMLEDFWLPKTASGGGTTVSNLPGGQNLGEIEDILYFQKNLYKALNVPIGRLESDQGFSFGRSNEIDRDEVRFQKFVDKLRIRFAEMFKEAIGTQIVLKGILTKEEWEAVQQQLIIDYNRDSFFSELKEAEILRERIETANAAEPLVGKYFSTEYIRRRIFKQTDEEIETIKDQIRKEALTNDELPDAERDGALDGGGGGGGLGGEGGGDFGGDFDDGEFGGEFDDGLNGEEGAADLVGEPEGAALDLGPDDEFEDDFEDETEFEDDF